MADNPDDPLANTTDASWRPPHTSALVAFAESAIAEDAAIVAARERSDELGASAVSPAAGAAIGLLARISNARAAVEIGTGAGVSGLWLLAGMRADGVLTTIDRDGDHQRAARTAFTDAGITGSRTRLINGRAGDVLPRLADGSYDLVFIDADVLDAHGYITEALRLLRDGGVLIVHNVLADGHIADPAHTDANTEAARHAATLISTNDELLPVVIPLGRGLLAATHVAVAEPTE